jgi:hypothetical protein
MEMSRGRPAGWLGGASVWIKRWGVGLWDVCDGAALSGVPGGVRRKVVSRRFLISSP